MLQRLRRADPADVQALPESQVECLGCGRARGASRGAKSCECPRCGYVGWAPSADLSEAARRLLRERPLERRRLRLV